MFGQPVKTVARDLSREIKEDRVTMGAAALAYYLMLSIFPATIALLSLIPYLPIPNLQQAIMDLIRQAMPGQSAFAFTGVVQDVVSNRRGGLLSFGLILTIWSASSGMVAVMQQLNATYDVREGRPFWKTRGTALLLTIGFGFLIIVGFALIVFGGVLQNLLANVVGMAPLLQVAFAVFRWLVILAFVLLGFAIVYYFGPDAEQRFRFVSPGSVVGTVLLAAASLGFRVYVSNFGSYNATYGSLGAVIVLMLWLYTVGLVLLVGSEVNALVEHYRPEGKEKGQRRLPRAGETRPGPALTHRAPEPGRP